MTSKFPKEELYGLSSQIRRAAISIPSNIAEGATRNHKKEFIQFLSIAYGSGAEIETQLLLCKELHYTENSIYEEANQLLLEVMKMLNKLLFNLKSTNN